MTARIFAPELTTDLVGVELDGFAPQKVGDVDFPDLTDLEPSLDQIGNGWNGPKAHPRPFASFDEGPDGLRGGAGQGDEDFLHAVLGANLADLCRPAEDFDVMDPAMKLRHFVVKEAHAMVPIGPHPQQRSHLWLIPMARPIRPARLD